MMKLVGLVIAMMVLSTGMVGADDQSADREALLAGVTDIGAPGVPGTVDACGGPAQVVVVGRIGSVQAPVAVTSRLGKGRVVALGHDGFLAAWAVDDPQTGRFLMNAIEWVALRRPTSIAVYGRSEFAHAMRARGLKVVELAGTLSGADLRGHSVLIADPGQLSESSLAAAAGFVRRGGGLIAANTAWGWLQLNPGRQLAADHPGNKLLSPAGIVWTDGMLDRTSPNRFAADMAVHPYAHAEAALTAIEAADRTGDMLPDLDATQASATIIRTALSLPATDSLLLPRLRRLQQAHATAAVPTAEKPLSSRQSSARLALALDLTLSRQSSPDRVMPHPAATAFPGPVPSDAPRVTRTIAVDSGITGWHSTGLYAPPGETIIVAAPPTAIGKGFAVRIGAHSDALWAAESWARAPEICRESAISQPETRAANAFGGLIYVVVPRSAPRTTLEFTITGAVVAPHFVLGRTDPTQWRREIRSRPAPWAELECSRVVLTIPSSVIRTLDDPVPLLEF